jgi:hypothetical protein
MTDGSVRTVPYTADLRVLKSIASVAGAETERLEE